MSYSVVKHLQLLPEIKKENLNLRIACPLLPFVFNIIQGVLVDAIKKKNGISIAKEEIKL